MATDQIEDLQLMVSDDNRTQTIAAATGETLLSQLQAAGISIGAVCGGGMMCGTCHVILTQSVVAALPPAADGEIELLEASDNYEPGRSRLACQVIVSPDIDALIEVAPDD